jgi:hypothetical protein
MTLGAGGAARLDYSLLRLVGKYLMTGLAGQTKLEMARQIFGVTESKSGIVEVIKRPMAAGTLSK